MKQLAETSRDELVRLQWLLALGAGGHRRRTSNIRSIQIASAGRKKSGLEESPVGKCLPTRSNVWRRSRFALLPPAVVAGRFPRHSTALPDQTWQALRLESMVSARWSAPSSPL